MAISLEEVRRRILIALFSDDELMDALVLKGGNALALVHHVGSRASLDMDFSMESAFPDMQEAKSRILAALEREFSSIGYVLFDGEFEAKPSQSTAGQPDWWGGYVVRFKLAERSMYDRLKADIQAVRRQSEVLGPSQQRTYTIDISRDEFCEGKVQREVDDYTIYVYSLEMIVAEKLRAICQQMPEYEFVRHKRPRARDFYDIHEVIAEHQIDMTSKDNLATTVSVFAAKRVPLRFLDDIYKYKSFHEPDWPSVEASISGHHESFEYYFNFVLKLASRLKATGIE